LRRNRTAQGQLIDDTGSKAAEGATTGAVGGTSLGGVVGFGRGGRADNSRYYPRISAGILTTVLGTAGATAVAGVGIGAVAGGLGRYFSVGLGIPESEAGYFLDTGFRSGSTLVNSKRVFA